MFKIILCAVAVAVLMTQPSRAGTPDYYVWSDANGNDDGSSWQDAFTDLQDALVLAGSGDVIWVGPGCYSPGGNATDTFTIPDGVTVAGGILPPGIFTGDTVLDGTLVNFHVVTMVNAQSDTILSGCWIVAGRADGVGTNQDRGGGLLVQGGAPTIIACHFGGAENGPGSHCHQDAVDEQNAAIYGGAIAVLSSDPLISDCTFQVNLAENDGGSMWVNDATLTLVDCDFSGGAALGSGGNLYATTSTVTMTDGCSSIGGTSLEVGGGLCLINCSAAFTDFLTSMCVSADFGGGIYVEDSTLQIEDSTLSKCHSDVGGHIHAADSDLTISDTIVYEPLEPCGTAAGISAADGSLVKLTRTHFTQSAALENAGALWSDSTSILSLRYCCIYSSSASGNGGAISSAGDVYCYNSVFRANGVHPDYSIPSDAGGAVHAAPAAGREQFYVNCLFLANSSSTAGGAVYVDAVDDDPKPVYIVNCTFYANESSDAGGVWSAGGADIANSILWNNGGSANADQLNFDSGNNTITYSNVQGGVVSGTGNISQDPEFTDVDEKDGIGCEDDFTLMSTSDCVDAGNNAVIPDDFADVDFDGTTAEATGVDLSREYRTLPSSSMASTVVDMGAYEFQWCDGLKGDANCDTFVNNFDSDCFSTALSSPSTWQSNCNGNGCDMHCVIDINRDGNINNFDIDPFIAILVGGQPVRKLLPCECAF